MRPKGVLLLAFTQAFESFSFYGMRALLALYLISELHYANKDAFALYALYIALVEVGSAIGGYIADRFVGYRAAVLIGGGFITFGHICMVFSTSLTLFFLGLGLIITGATLFRSNLKALLGLLYQKADAGRESGFTLLYMGINVGGFMAALACGVLAELYGWHVGFGAAALGMIIGMAIFTLQSPQFKKIDTPTNSPITPILLGGALSAIGFAYLLSHFHTATILLLPISLISFGVLIWVVTKNMTARLMWTLVGILLLLIAYFSVEELMGSLLMVFSDTHVNRTLLGMQIPPSLLIAINPLIIMSTGPLMARLKMSLPSRLSIAFLCLSLAFATLYLASLIILPSVLYIVVSFSLIALGELFLAPAVFAFCSKIAPKKGAGLMMGLVTLAFSLAGLLSGQTSSLSYTPSTLFVIISISAALISLTPLLLGNGHALLKTIRQKP